MKNQQIVFTKVNTAELLDVDIPPLADDHVIVKTMVSTISCGTERANLTGDPNISIYTDENSEVVFPRYAGYSSSGVVMEIGKSVTTVKPGDRVAMYWSNHKLYNVVPEGNLVKIEDDNISFEEAAICHIGNFPMAALRKTRVEIGESAMVMGLGTLGLLGITYLHAAGAAPVIAVDPVEERRLKALKFGADYAFDPTEEGFSEKIKELTGGGVNAAIEVTGLGIGLDQCLDCMAKFGRVALLGCTRNKNFTIDYYRKVHAPGISLIGAHTQARPMVESHSAYFTHNDDIRAQLRLISNKRVDLKSMIDETYSPEDCGEVYTRLATDRNFPTFVQFDWRKLDK